MIEASKCMLSRDFDVLLVVQLILSDFGCHDWTYFHPEVSIILKRQLRYLYKLYLLGEENRYNLHIQKCRSSLLQIIADNEFTAWMYIIWFLLVYSNC